MIIVVALYIHAYPSKVGSILSQKKGDLDLLRKNYRLKHQQFQVPMHPAL